MKSVMSFPNRGHWGKSNWRGNTSGHVIKEMIEHFQPKLFVDACEGSGSATCCIIKSYTISSH